MIFTPEPDLNETAYRRLKPEIDRTYPPGRFIAIDEGKSLPTPTPSRATPVRRPSRWLAI